MKETLLTAAKYSVVIGFVVLLFLFLTWQNYQGIKLDKSILELKSNIQILNNNYKSKLMEMEKLRASNRVLKLAEHNLGMIPSSTSDFKTLSLDDIDSLFSIITKDQDLITLRNDASSAALNQP